jgi:hypothetical protein
LDPDLVSGLSLELDDVLRAIGKTVINNRHKKKTEDMAG